MSPEVRDSFAHLILLCLAHHSAVDNPRSGEKYYPAELLLDWKRRREGKDGPLLGQIEIPANDPDAVTRYLEETFEPPLKRLEDLADRLQRTGQLTENNLAELSSIVTSMQDAPAGVDQHTARMLLEAADILSHQNLDQASARLAEAADIMANLPSREHGEW